MTSPAPRSRAGRPSAREVRRRRQAVLDATAQLLATRGGRGTTTTAVAELAGVSKESLYSWFGDKNALFTALVEANAARMNEQIADGLARRRDAETTLEAFAVDLLRLLTGELSLAVNRAAIAELPASCVMADALLRHGRRASGALVEQYLAVCMDRGLLPRADPATSFELLYGLVVQDTQIRCLLGEPSPDAAVLAQRATLAVRRFLMVLAAEEGAGQRGPSSAHDRGVQVAGGPQQDDATSLG